MPLTDLHTGAPFAEIIIVGGGPAGYTAAIYAARAMMAPVMFTGMQPGGQLTITTDVENFPGFADTIQGPWLMEQMQKQAEHAGASIIYETVADIDMSARPFAVTLADGTVWACNAVILATGAQARWLGLPGEEAFRGFGVSACATCDGFFYRGKSVIVVGGGNTAVEEALYLSNIAATVALVHRGSRLRAEQRLQQRLFDKANITVIWDTELADIVGDREPVPGVTGALLRHRQTGQETLHAADGIFVAIGHTPMVELVQGKLRLRDDGYVWTQPGSTVTSVEGVFAAGDVTDSVFRQAVTAAGQGCMAALEAERYIAARADAKAA